jgi:hypothetical protein
VDASVRHILAWVGARRWVACRCTLLTHNVESVRDEIFVRVVVRARLAVVVKLVRFAWCA